MANTDTTAFFSDTVFDPTSPQAGADLSAYQHRIVKSQGTVDGDVIAATAGTGYGILANAPDDNGPARVAVGGPMKVMMGSTTGTVKRGTKLKADASAEATAADTDEDWYVCSSLEDDPTAATLCIVMVGCGYYAVA